MKKLKVNLVPLARQVMGRNRDQPSMFTPAIFIGGGLGILAGAGTALLLAPQSGRRTQAILRRESNKLKRQAGRTVEDVQTSIEDAKGRIRELQQDGQSFLTDQASRVQDTLAGAKKALKPIKVTSTGGLLSLAVPLVTLVAVMNLLRARGG